MKPKEIFVHYQIMHVIIIIHKTSNVKVDFKHQIDLINFKYTSNLIYDTKTFQILYSTYHRLN
jgi:hypothetical protein